MALLNLAKSQLSCILSFSLVLPSVFSVCAHPCKILLQRSSSSSISLRILHILCSSLLQSSSLLHQTQAIYLSCQAPSHPAKELSFSMTMSSPSHHSVSLYFSLVNIFIETTSGHFSLLLLGGILVNSSEIPSLSFQIFAENPSLLCCL